MEIYVTELLIERGHFRIFIKSVKVYRFQNFWDQITHEAVYQFCINPDLSDSSPPGHPEQKKSGH